MTSSQDSLTGRVLEGKYRLDERIGRGGMGEVYRGLHLMMERTVAIKVLRADVAEDPTAIRRFVREAKSTFRLEHAHCVRVTDLGAEGGEILYLVMEFLDGRTVYDEVEIDGPLSARRVAHIARQVCDALDYAHGMGFIHRDLKPENIMLVSRNGDHDFAKVLDFGLAKIMTGPDGMNTKAISVAPLTRQGMVFGTPEYMSPEQASDHGVTPSTDLYSLGVVMYEMLTGELPFSSDNFMHILAQHIQETPTPPATRRPDLAIPDEIDRLVVQCLSKQPAERPADARALSARLAELEAVYHDAPGSLPDKVSSSSTVDLSQVAVLAAASNPSLGVSPQGPPLQSKPMTASLRQPSPGPGAMSDLANHIDNDIREHIDSRIDERIDTTGETHGWGRTPTPLESAETMGLPSMSPSMSSPSMSSPSLSSPSLVTPPMMSADDQQRLVPTHEVRQVPTSGRWWIAATALGVLVTATLGVVLAMSGGDSSATAEPTTAVPVAAGDSASVDDPPGDPSSPPTTTPSDSAGDRDSAASGDPTSHPSGESGDPGADPGSASTATPTGGSTSSERARKKRLKTHIDSAEKAREAGNLLKQMAEAQAAWRIDRRDPRARYLFGDALVRTGDPANRSRGCKLLRRARGVSAARSAYRAAKCSQSD